MLDALVGAGQTGDTRSAPQRREAALADLARHTLDCPAAELPATASGRAQVLVVVRLETLAGQPNTSPARYVGADALLTGGQLLRLTCDADLARVVLDPAGAVVDVGRLTRTVSPAQWRGLLARDGRCVVRGCRRRPSGCQAHHVQHWARGGKTNLTNLALLCHSHHTELHDTNSWLRHTDGRWITPDGYLQDWNTGPPPFP